MPDVGRGKKVGSFALFDALAQHAGWPEVGDNAGARGLVISLADFADHLAQAAGSQHMYLVGSPDPIIQAAQIVANTSIRIRRLTCVLWIDQS